MALNSDCDVLPSEHFEHGLNLRLRELERIVLSYLFLRQNRKQCIKRQEEDGTDRVLL